MNKCHACNGTLDAKHHCLDCNPQHVPCEEVEQVRETIAKLFANPDCGLSGWRYMIAGEILRSSDLRVMLAPQKYQATGKYVYRFLNITTTLVAECLDDKYASDFADFLNSKESK